MSKKTITVTRKQTENGIQHSIEKMLNNERQAVVHFILPYIKCDQPKPAPIRGKVIGSPMLTNLENNGIEFTLVGSESETVVANLERYMQGETITCKLFGKPHNINLVFISQAE